jgi:hypothetical protein
LQADEVDSFFTVASVANVIEGNGIGTNATGTLDLGNGQNGIGFLPRDFPTSINDNTIGGTASGAGNFIINNTALGIFPAPPASNVVIGNVLAPNKNQVIDLAVHLATSPNIPIVGHPYTAAFTVTNNGLATATGVSLQIRYLPPGLIVNSAVTTQGTIVAVPGGPNVTYLPQGKGFLASFGSLAVGASATVTLTVTPVTQDALGLMAVASGDQFELNPPNQTVSIDAIEVLPATTLVGTVPISSGLAITSVRLTFSADLSQASASNVANYRVTTLGSGRRGNSTVKIDSAIYDPGTRSVVLNLVRPLPALGTFVRVSAGGPGTPGLVDAVGNPVQGNDGSPGSASSSVVALGTRLSYLDSSGNLVTLQIAFGGSLQLQLAPNGDAQAVVLQSPIRGRSVLSGSVRRFRGRGTGQTPLPVIQNLSALDSRGIRLTNPPFVSSQLSPPRRR